jgi:hypothetical protein
MINNNIAYKSTGEFLQFIKKQTKEKNIAAGKPIKGPNSYNKKNKKNKDNRFP